MLLLYELLSFPANNNLGMKSSKRQTNFGMLQIDTENSAIGGITKLKVKQLNLLLKIVFQQFLVVNAL